MPEEWNVIEPIIEAPVPESPSFIAHKLFVAKDPTQRLVLQAVASGPKRFKDLKETTGQPDGQINRALEILHDEGVLVERLHARSAPVYKTHELGTKGILVISMMKAFQDAERSVAVKPMTSIAYVLTKAAAPRPRALPMHAMRAKKAALGSRSNLGATRARKTASKSTKTRSSRHVKV